MSSISSHFALARNAVIVVAILALGIQLWAQTPVNSTASQNPFGQLDKALSNAADNLLSAAAQRPLGLTLRRSASDQRVEIPGARNVAMRWKPRGIASQRVEQLRPLIEPILREEGVPTELAAVVLVESGGQPAALSPKGARGIWQLMPNTARRYGLIVASLRDDRTDPERSTRAAARYLRDLYAQFGDWSLALAAYNAGELLVESAISRTGATDFAGLIKEGRIPSETRNYVPTVWAAVERLGSQLGPKNRMPSKAAEVVYAFAELQN